MPDPDPKPVTEPWRCKNCRKDFPHMNVVTVAGIRNLLIGTAKIFRIEAVCTNCGTVNHWNQRESEMTEQTQIFLILLAELHGGKTLEPEL